MYENYLKRTFKRHNPRVARRTDLVFIIEIRQSILSRLIIV